MLGTLDIRSHSGVQVLIELRGLELMAKPHLSDSEEALIVEECIT